MSISSQVIYGPIGNSAAVPVMQYAGHTVLAVPTTVLSNHPGHGTPSGLDIPAETISASLATLETQGWLSSVDAVLTGYFRSAEQIEAVVPVISAMKQHNPGMHYLCDPIIGDSHTGIYVPKAVAEVIRDRLLPLANTTTPNIFELGWLAGKSATDLRECRISAKNLQVPTVLVPTVLVTSAATTEDTMTTALFTEANDVCVTTSSRSKVPHGTGDLLAGLNLTDILSGHTPAASLGRAMARLEHCLDHSASNTVLDIAGSMTGFSNVDALPVRPCV